MSDKDKKNALDRPERFFENLIFVKFSKIFQQISKASYAILSYIQTFRCVPDHFSWAEKIITRNFKNLKMSILYRFHSEYSRELSWSIIFGLTILQITLRAFPLVTRLTAHWRLQVSRAWSLRKRFLRSFLQLVFV